MYVGDHRLRRVSSTEEGKKEGITETKRGRREGEGGRGRDVGAGVG